MSGRCRTAASALLLAALGAPACARAQALVAQDGATATIACRGDVAELRGDGNRLTFAGPCRGLVVRGTGNAVGVDLAGGASVSVIGDNNRIAYTAAGGVPVRIVHGRNDDIAPYAGPPGFVTLAEPGPLIVSGPPYDLPCGDRDVIVRGIALSLVLRGGCRSLTIEGRLDTVTAELLPGAPVAIGGPGVLVNYVLVAEGAPPTVRTTGRHLRATHIQHFGGTQLALPTEAAAR